MKKLAWLTAIVLWPALATAQSTLNFPRSFTSQDRQLTGFAIVNPGSSDAIATFTLYDNNGATLAFFNQTIPRGGQLATFGSQIFAGITGSGWVQVTSSTSGLQGFWMGVDFVNLTRGDGAVSAPLSVDQAFPFVPAATQLSIANPGTDPISIMIRAFNDSGAEVGTNTRLVAAKGITQFDIATIVQSGTADSVRIQSSSPFAALAVLRGTSSLDNAVQNGIDVTLLSEPLPTDLVFPHFVDGVLGDFTYNSIISVVNLAALRVVTVHLTFVPDNGAPAVESLDFPLFPQSSLKGLANTFFRYNEFGYHSGYVRVTSDGPIAGTIDYGSTGNGGEAIVPAQLTPQTSMIFAQIADLQPWYTGMALQNPSNAAATVEVFAINPNGTLIGGAANVPSARFILPPGAKTAKLLSELIPQTQSRLNDGGFVFIRSTNGVPIHAIQLLFTRNQKTLACIPAIPLPPEFNYTPPTR